MFCIDIGRWRIIVERFFYSIGTFRGWKLGLTVLHAPIKNNEPTNYDEWKVS